MHHINRDSQLTKTDSAALELRKQRFEGNNNNNTKKLENRASGIWHSNNDSDQKTMI